MPRRIALDNLTPEGAQAVVRGILSPDDELPVVDDEVVGRVEECVQVDDIVDHIAAFRAGHAAALLGRQVA